MKDIYVKFDSPAIKGESQDKDHKGLDRNQQLVAGHQPTAFGHGLDRRRPHG